MAGGTFVTDDKSIEACNREIPSGRFSGEMLRMMYLQRAASHLRKYQIDLAQRDCDAAAKIAEDSDTFRCRASVYVAMGAHGRVITELDEAVRIFPKDVIALSARGAAFLARNDLVHAMADLDKAIDIAPEFANALRLRGAVHEKMSQHDRAVADFDRAIAIYDKRLKLYSVPLLRANVLAARANAYNAKGERDRAVADYDRAIAILPDRVSQISSRANVLNQWSDRERAVAELDRVIRLEPANPRGYIDRGAIFHAKGDRDRAIADYDQAIRLDPKYASAFYMPDAISTREMVKALRGIGFVEASRHGSHLMLRHQKTGLLVTLPTDRAYVPLVYMRAILQQLINYRIETPEELRRVFHILEPSL